MDEDTPDDYALERVGWITRDLAGNMLRVMRGAGKPLELLEQLNTLGKAINTAQASVIEINEAMQDALAFGFKEEALDDMDRIALRMERAAARMIAARLLCQPLQVTKGRSEFYDSFYDLERLRKKNREEYLATLAKQTPAPKRSKARKAPTIQAPSSKPKTAPAPADEDIDPRSWKTTAEYMKLRREQLLRQRGGK